jgi:hypothetical protein
MSAPIYPIQVNVGTSYSLPIAWQVNGVPQSIQGYLFHCEVREQSRPNSVVTFTVDWTELVTYATGWTALVFTPQQTSTLIRRGYYYIINMTDATGFVRRILEGEIGVNR